MESYLYEIGYLSPLEYTSLTSKSFDDSIQLQSYCMDDVIKLWQQDHCIIIRHVCYYDEKDKYYMLSDYKLPYHVIELYLIKENESLFSLYSSLFEWRMESMLFKKEKEFYDIAVQHGHPCHYEWMWNWMDNNPYESNVFNNIKKIMMKKIHMCYQPGGKGYHWSKYNFVSCTKLVD